jgi:hypothetical protein
MLQGLKKVESGNEPSISFPRYVWPDVISSVTMWPWASLRSLMGMPIVDVIVAAV